MCPLQWEISVTCLLPVESHARGCKLPVKGQMAHSFSFVGHAVSVVVTQLCRCSTKAVIIHKRMDMARFDPKEARQAGPWSISRHRSERNQVLVLEFQDSKGVRADVPKWEYLISYVIMIIAVFLRPFSFLWLSGTSVSPLRTWFMLVFHLFLGWSHTILSWTSACSS